MLQEQSFEEKYSTKHGNLKSTESVRIFGLHMNSWRPLYGGERLFSVEVPAEPLSLPLYPSIPVPVL